MARGWLLGLILVIGVGSVSWAEDSLNLSVEERKAASTCYWEEATDGLSVIALPDVTVFQSVAQCSDYVRFRLLSLWEKKLKEGSDISHLQDFFGLLIYKKKELGLTMSCVTAVTPGAVLETSGVKIAMSQLQNAILSATEADRQKIPELEKNLHQELNKLITVKCRSTSLE